MHTKRPYSDDSIVLHLSLINGVGPETIRQIIDSVPHATMTDLYGFTTTDLINRCGIPPRRAELLVNGLKERTHLEKELALLDRSAAHYISIANPSYPELLKNITSPPPILYYQGAGLETYQEPAIALVGSRQANHYAHRVIDRFVKQFVSHRITIVSGGARGADSMAHQATVTHKGRTIAILGSGLLHQYPYENKKLFSEIIECNGTILSIFSMNTAPEAHNFPARNRVISGISRGCVVVQAAAKSGAYITARFALEQGREVCAVPGDIDDPLSAGCHTLLKEGATVADSAESVLAACGIHDSSITPATQESQSVIGNGEHTVESDILQHCLYPVLFDDLCEKIALTPAQLQQKLFALQLAGKITQQFTGAWVASRG